MARTKNNVGEKQVDPAAVQYNINSAVQNELMKELLSESFEDPTTKITPEGVSMVVEVAKGLVSETCLRASSSAGHEHCDKVGMSQVEKCLTQVLLDFP